ncbi:MAG: DinB family protein [Chloroflexi bacterium]|nr:DinB family protein [Chloroflexota bacterium]
MIVITLLCPDNVAHVTISGMSTVETLLDKLDQTRVYLLVAIESLSDDALLVPETIGRFSIAELLVHLTAWEAELVTGLMQIDQGKKPTKLLNALANKKAYSKQRHQEMKGRNLDLVFDDLQKVRLQLEKRIDHFSERSLSDSNRYKWLKGKSIAQLVKTTTFANEARFVPLIEAYAKKWEQQQQTLIIPLTAVPPKESPDESSH